MSKRGEGRRSGSLIRRHGGTVLAATTDAVVFFRRDGLILEFNDAAAKMFGFTAAELGRHFKDFLVDPPHERARHMVRLGEPFEMTAERTDGTRFAVDLQVVAVPGTEPLLFASFIRGIEKRKEIEAELGRAKEEAEAANLARSSFLSSISHEVRTPLSVIAGVAEALADTGLTAEQRQLQGDLSASVQVLLRRMDELLDLTKLETGQVDFLPRPFSLDAWIEDACRLVRPQAAAKGLELAVAAAGADVALVGDPERLQAVLVNLLSNAVKFSDQGQVLLAVTAEEVADGMVRLGAAVSDEGVGVAPEHRERIFERFFRAPGTGREGSGLGLSIASGLAYMMGGRLWLEDSAPGRGSTFRFEVTLARTKEAPGPQPLPAPALERPARLLLAEDHEPIRRILTRFLQAGGYDVDAVPDGYQAEVCVLEREYDVILLDVEMPGLDGIETARRIRGSEVALGRGPAVLVALTAHVFRDFRERYLGAGMNHYLVKPVSREALLRRIALILGERELEREGALPEAGSESPIPVRVDPDILDLVDEFLAGRNQDVAAMDAELARGVLEGIAIRAHNIKGSAGAYGFHHLSHLGALLLRAADTGDVRHTREVVQEIASYLRRVRPVT